MKAWTCFVLFLSIGGICAAAQGAQAPTRNIDWTQLSPGVVDLAYDWVDAVSREAEVIDKREDVFAPRQAEADTIMRKLQRKISWGEPEETAADAEVYSAVVGFAFKISACRTLQDSDPECTMQTFSSLETVANRRLKQIQKLASTPTTTSRQ